MKSIKTEIIIKASKESVWKVLMNHSAYPIWNPFIKNISGSPIEGGNLAVTIQSGKKEPMDFNPIVLKNKTNDEFRWKGKVLINGLFDGEHYFKIHELGNGYVRFTHGENFSGLLSGVLFGFISEDTKSGFEQMNAALKKIVERN